MKIGGLCFGYGGLDLAVQQVIPDAELAWYAEFDKGASKIGAHRFPGVPNHGDMTAIDWTAVEPVDILTGGTPCQDLSHAGKRQGMTEGTRSNLWVAMREAIAALQPSLVVWENVAGAYSATADSELERREGRVGGGPGRPALRALGRVLGDLATLGYDAQWHGLRAADVGAPHGRLRVFLIATDARRADGKRGTGAIAGSVAAGSSAGALERPASSSAALLPTPTSSDTNGVGAHGDGGVDLRTAISLLPTPSVADIEGGRKRRSGDRSGELLLNGIAAADLWGNYAPAIHRWERALGRPHPVPTMTSGKGTPQLSHVFVEWLMGLPAGWVTDVPGITRNEALKALGNGVVPQQATAALRLMLTKEQAA